MSQPIIPLLRLGLMIPAALAASLAAQYVFTKAAWLVIHPTPATYADWMTWAAKCCAVPFVAAVFVLAMWGVAPAAYRKAVAVGSLAVVGLWGALMIFGAFFGGGPQFNVWLFVMGLAGWLGGILAFLSTRIRVRTQPV